MSLLALSGTNSVSGGYEIENSCKFEDDNDEWLYRTNASGTNRKTWTVSWWFKQTELATQLGHGTEIWQGGVFGEATRAGMWADDRLWIDIGGGTGNAGNLFRSLSTARLRDTAAWYHVVIACDTTQSTEADRLKVWLNGVEVTEWDQKQYPTLNYESALQAAIPMKWGSYDSTYNGYSGYLAECNYVDGVTATQNDFGEFDDNSGIWKPKEYTGSYGTNGSYLDFKIASDLGANAKGNDVNFSLNNITSADQATDTPTNNFCTLNPLWTFANTMGVSDGGTKVNNTVTAWGGAKGSIGVNSGKWYWEHGSFSGNDTMFGIQNQAGGGNTQAYLDPYTLAIQANSNVIQFTDPSNRTEAFSKTFSVSDIWGVALDLDANTIAYYRNGSIVNSAFSIDGLIGNGEFFPFVTHYGSGLNSRVNFGGYTGITISSGNSDENGYGNFEYAPPSGYYALCTKNLAEYG
jgi:hypothetical protein